MVHGRVASIPPEEVELMGIAAPVRLRVGVPIPRPPLAPILLRDPRGGGAATQDAVLAVWGARTSRHKEKIK